MKKNTTLNTELVLIDIISENNMCEVSRMNFTHINELQISLEGHINGDNNLFSTSTEDFKINISELPILINWLSTIVQTTK